MLMMMMLLAPGRRKRRELLREPTEMQALPVKIYNKRNREGKWGWVTLDLPLSS